MLKKLADENGFTDIINKQNLVPGDKVYFINRGKKYVFGYNW